MNSDSSRISAEQRAAITANRFGLGIRPGDPEIAGSAAALLAELDRYQPRPDTWAATPSTVSLVAAGLADGRALRQADSESQAGLRKQQGEQSRQRYLADVEARVATAVSTPAAFAERLVHFWSSHFAVSVDKRPVTTLAGAFELEAIRPHLLGRFEDMLLAVERHPAMLFYLDQVRSIRPDSPAARRAERPGRNDPRRRGPSTRTEREPGSRDPRAAHAGRSQWL